MRTNIIAGLAAAVAVALTTTTTTAPASGQGRETCAAPLRVVQKTFKKLAAPNAYVWVDDISSNIRGGYAPFQIAVVVGSAYPPFRADEGRLERASFESLMRNAYGVSRANGTVSEAAMKTGVAVSFTAARQKYVLRVVSVQTSKGGDDAMTVKLCR